MTSKERLHQAEQFAQEAGLTADSEVAFLFWQDRSMTRSELYELADKCQRGEPVLTSRYDEDQYRQWLQWREQSGAR